MTTGPGDLALQSTRQNGMCTVSLDGDLDLATVGRVELGLEEAANSDAERIVLDLSGLGFMDATGVGLLLRLRHRYGKRLAVRRPSGSADRVIDLTGVAPLIGFD